MVKRADVIHFLLSISTIALLVYIIRQQVSVEKMVSERPTVEQVDQALGDALGAIFEGTLTYAASWIDSGDGMSYTFTLTKGVKETSDSFRRKFREELTERIRNPQDK